MSMKLEAGDCKKGDLFSIFPQDIVVDPTKNTRKVPHTPEQVQALAQSILANRQQQPAVVRRIDGNRVQLVAGYGRWQAVNHINSILQPDNPVRLQCKVSDLNEEEAFIASLVENLDRAETTPVDDAHAQRVLRETYLWEEERIAAFYRKSVSHLGKLREVLKLSTPIQKEVSDGNLSVDGAVALAKLPERERMDVVETTKDANGKVNAQAVDALAKLPQGVREDLVNDHLDSGEPILPNQARAAVRTVKQARGKRGPKRNMKELAEFLEGMTGNAEQRSCRKLAENLLAYIGGKISDEDMAKVMREQSIETGTDALLFQGDPT